MHLVLLQCNFELVLNIIELVHNQIKGNLPLYVLGVNSKLGLIPKMVAKSPFQGRNFLVEEVDLR